MSWDASTATHVYRRAGFGADRARIEHAAAGDLDAALADLFGRRAHDPALLHGIRPLLALEQLEPLQSWWMALILADGAPLVERVALMWHDHFATSNDKVLDPRLMHGQVQLFRDQGLGDFRTLLHAVAKDPAMLVWLDGNANRKGEPNENFAREVLELFGLGLGNYTERDIQEAARAFTGWGVERRRFVFKERYHDDGEKEFLGERGRFGGDDVLERILAHPACARLVARRLLAEFVHPAPTDAEVSDWAGVLVAEEWNVERTLQRLFRCELFLGPRARRSRIAGPVELVAVTAITLGAHLTPREAARAADEMGQALLRPPSVKGWDGGRAWIHAGSWLARHNRLTQLANAPDGARVDLFAACGEPGDRAAVPAAVLGLLLPEGAGDELLAAARRTADAAADVQRALQDVAALVLTAPEYHLI
jgi:uncharacterized protein (DUF1800 family)